MERRQPLQKAGAAGGGHRDLVGVPLGDVETHGSDAEAHATAPGENGRPRIPRYSCNIYPVTAAVTSSNIGFAVADLSVIDGRLRAAGVAVVRAPEDRPWGRTAAYRDRTAIPSSSPSRAAQSRLRVRLLLVDARAINAPRESGERYSEERADDAGELDPDEHRQQRGEGMETDSRA